jgi:alkyldihydroxyacetonephosphate synthase
MSSLVRSLSEELPGLRTSDDEADRLAYARDLWPRHHMNVRGGRPATDRPNAVAWPTTTEEVARVVRWARAQGVPIVPFGAGSGVCGGVLPADDVLVVDLKRMGRLRTIEHDAPLVDAEAGCLGLPLEQALERAGLTLGHFPSSILCSTVGGWIAARSAGQCSGAYGKIEDMVASLECVTGAGHVVELRRRSSKPDLVPLVVGSEGTMAIVTSARLRLHPAPRRRAFGAWSFPQTRDGWEGLRAIFQSGLRPAVARLYDPFDAMLARRSTSRAGDGARHERSAPGLGGAALRALVRRPAALNALLGSRAASRVLGGALLVVVFEGDAADPQQGLEDAKRTLAPMGASWEGEAPARHWLEHRYAVSYRQAPVFASGAFVDTMEVAARWSKLGDVYEAVRRALGEHAFVMAHFSHAYPDGCCIYFSFAGAAAPDGAGDGDWERACQVTYDRAWTAALTAAVEAGGTLAHHHGVGRSKAPRLAAELGDAVDVVRGLMRAFDPAGILNPGNLVGGASPVARMPAHDASGELEVDRESLLVRAEGHVLVAALEQRLRDTGLTLDVHVADAPALSDWLAQGAPGARDRWLDPADQLIAGLDASLWNGHAVRVRPAPRRAVGPDLTALFVGAGERFGRIERVWLRVHAVGATRPTSAPFRCDRDPPMNAGEKALLDALERQLNPRA